MSHVIALSDPAALRLRLLEMLLPHAGSYAVEMAREAEAWVLGATAAPPPPAPEVVIRVEIPIEEPRHVQDAPPPPPAGADVEGDRAGQPPDGDDLQPGAEPGDDRDGGAEESGHPAPAESAGPEGEDAGELTELGQPGHEEPADIDPQAEWLAVEETLATEDEPENWAARPCVKIFSAEIGEPQSESRRLGTPVLAEIRAMLAAGEAVTGAAVARRMGLAQPVASKHIRELEACGVLHRQGRGKNVKFVLAQTNTAPELTAPAPAAPGKDFLWTPERREILAAGKVAWTEARKEQLRALCAEGLETREIEERMGLPAGRNLVHASAGRFGFTPMWRFARDARRAAAASAAEPVEPPIAVEPVAEQDITDRVAATLAADKPEAGAFPVQPKSLAEVEAPPLPRSEQERLIAEHIKAKGVTKEVDFGPDQPAVDVLKETFNTVLKNKPHTGRGKPHPWLVNGAPRTTQQLWDQANRERRDRGLKPIKRAD